MALKPCKVIIAGAGLAGLTLALTLEKTGVDYVLLEAYPDIIAHAGAGICLLPNALRILDQLGCYEDLVSRVKQGVDDINMRKPDGESMKPSSNWWSFHIQRCVRSDMSFLPHHVLFFSSYFATWIVVPVLTNGLDMGTASIGVTGLRFWRYSMIMFKTSRKSYRTNELTMFNMLLIRSP